MNRNIRRIVVNGRTRARAAIFNDLVITVSTARADVPGVEAQAREAFRLLDQNLEASGADKSSLLLVLVCLNDIASKPEFNREWDAWVDKAAPPVRVCIGARLEEGDLVELIAIAAGGNMKGKFDDEPEIG